MRSDGQAAEGERWKVLRSKVEMEPGLDLDRKRNCQPCKYVRSRGLSCALVGFKQECSGANDEQESTEGEETETAGRDG